MGEIFKDHHGKCIACHREDIITTHTYKEAPPGAMDSYPEPVECGPIDGAMVFSTLHIDKYHRLDTSYRHGVCRKCLGAHSIGWAREISQHITKTVLNRYLKIFIAKMSIPVTLRKRTEDFVEFEQQISEYFSPKFVEETVQMCHQKSDNVYRSRVKLRQRLIRELKKLGLRCWNGDDD